jgi:hypothetical protein
VPRHHRFRSADREGQLIASDGHHVRGPSTAVRPSAEEAQPQSAPPDTLGPGRLKGARPRSSLAGTRMSPPHGTAVLLAALEPAERACASDPARPRAEAQQPGNQTADATHTTNGSRNRGSQTQQSSSLGNLNFASQRGPPAADSNPSWPSDAPEHRQPRSFLGNPNFASKIGPRLPRWCGSPRRHSSGKIAKFSC